ncbi:MAG TPA: HlyD family efflux transporter periplasmic adaptor subunit [Bacteroidales bacterium]|nr:HlyD family efflux transporter periplasmic adaptor subunit [Bacteroidales bacterium]HPS18040.1 HlyD family efflux transporter periplasmic adaptor subunit [Bacteroidales bacterium]
MEEEFKNIEIRSEEIEEILGKAPNWIISRGITIIFSVIALIFIGSWFFKYPDIITSTVVITSENVPATIVAKTSGKITDIIVNDNQEIKKNEYIAVIENPANDRHVKEVSEKLDSLKSFISDFDIEKIKTINIEKSYSLGDLQTYFSSFRKDLEDYKNFIDKDYQHKKIASIQEQIIKYKQMYAKLVSQQDIMQQKLNIGGSQFNRDSSLFSEKTIALADFEKSKTTLLENKYSVVSSSATLDNTLISISQLEQSILELEQDYAEKKKSYELSLNESFDNLQTQIKLWEQTYILKSPIDGIVTFTKIWSENQNVTSGDKVLTVIPKEKSKILGKLTIPVDGSGKVKVGQKVNIKLANYPYMEYGMVEGKIKSISLVPTDNSYIAEVEFSEGLKTNYGKQLEFGQEMQGQAEIITDDLRLIERFFNPIKSLLKKQ